MSEGLAGALCVAAQCSEKRDFDILWAKIKPFTEALCSHDYWLTPYFIRPLGPNLLMVYDLAEGLPQRWRFRSQTAP